jgi:hypothetical protein
MWEGERKMGERPSQFGEFTANNPKHVRSGAKQLDSLGIACFLIGRREAANGRQVPNGSSNGRIDVEPGFMGPREWKTHMCSDGGRPRHSASASSVHSVALSTRIDVAWGMPLSLLGLPPASMRRD